MWRVDVGVRYLRERMPYCYANQDGIPVGRGLSAARSRFAAACRKASADDEVTERRCASLKSRQSPAVIERKQRWRQVPLLFVFRQSALVVDFILFCRCRR